MTYASFLFSLLEKIYLSISLLVHFRIIFFQTATMLLERNEMSTGLERNEISTGLISLIALRSLGLICSVAFFPFLCKQFASTLIDKTARAVRNKYFIKGRLKWSNSWRNSGKLKLILIHTKLNSCISWALICTLLAYLHGSRQSCAVPDKLFFHDFSKLIITWIINY